MDVTLTRETKRFVQNTVKSGRFATTDEAVNQLLLQLKEQEELTPKDIEELRLEVDRGLDDLQEGRIVAFTAEEIIKEGHAALAAKRKKR